MVKLDIGKEDAIEMATHMIACWGDLPKDSKGCLYIVTPEQYEALDSAIHNTEEFWAALDKPNYDNLSEVAKAELRASARGPKPKHDGMIDAMQYALKAKDMVNHPKHYNKGRYEVIDIIESVLESMDLTPVEAMLTAQIIKYIARWKNKGGVEDLKKAEWYLRRLIG